MKKTNIYYINQTAVSMLDDLDEGYYFFFDLFSSVLWNKSFAGKSNQEVISILYQFDVMLMWYVIKQNK